MRRADLTVQVSTKLNRSHLVHGREALILPTLGRTEKDRTGGRTQRITVEDSVCAVHASQGPLEPAGPQLRSEVDIVCSIAAATLGDRHGIPWEEFRDRLHRDPPADRPGRARLRGVRREGRPARRLPAAAPARATPARSRPRPGAAKFAVSPIDVLHVPRGPAAAADAALARPVQHHDLRSRRPLPRRLRRSPRGLRAPASTSPSSASSRDQYVDLVSEWTDGSERKAAAFRVVPYDQPRGCAAAYYPETNPLIPLDSTALQSNCPTSKSVIVRLEPVEDSASRSGGAHGAAGGSTGNGGERGQDEGHKSRPEPTHLS